VLTVAGLAHASSALAQTPPRAPASAGAISAMCAQSGGSKPTDELIGLLAERQRQTVVSALRGASLAAARRSARTRTAVSAPGESMPRRRRSRCCSAMMPARRRASQACPKRG